MPLIPRKKVQPTNNSDICDHLLYCNNILSFDNFSILSHENKKYLLNIKKSHLIEERQTITK